MTTRDVQPGKPGDGPPGVVAVDLGRLDDVTSTLLKALGEHRARVADAGSGAVLTGVSPAARAALERSGLLDAFGAENVLPDDRWLAIAVALLVRYPRAGALPFHLGWWAFVFPLGAHTVATLTLARTWQIPALDTLAALLYVALVGFWVVVAARTITATRTWAIWAR